MWEADKKNLVNQIRIIKSKGWVTNIEIETIRRKIENESRDEVNKVQYKIVITQRTLMMKKLISPMQRVRMKNPLE